MIIADASDRLEAMLKLCPGIRERFSLVIDGRNCIYRSVYANRGDGARNPVHDSVVALRFIGSWIDRFAPADINIFWDAPRTELWRRKIFPGYKDRPSSDPDIGKAIGNAELALKCLSNHLNIRQFSRIAMEADDLIYGYCRVAQDRPIIVVSSDSDFRQLMFTFQNVLLYEPRQNQFIDRPAVNPVITKSLMGDESDTINGYMGIGKVKSAKLASSLSDRVAFLQQRGRSVYSRNQVLIDLGLCPYLLANMTYIEKQMMEPIQFDKKAINEVKTQHRINGMIQELESLIRPFNNIGVIKPTAMCPVCNETQRLISSGWVCSNGHGFGEPTLKS